MTDHKINFLSGVDTADENLNGGGTNNWAVHRKKD